MFHFCAQYTVIWWDIYLSIYILLALIYKVYDLHIGHMMSILEDKNHRLCINKRLSTTVNEMGFLLRKDVAFLLLL